jgi:hypothetical protein
MVNSYLIEDAGAITFIDAGLRYWKDRFASSRRWDDPLWISGRSC